MMKKWSKRIQIHTQTIKQYHIDNNQVNKDIIPFLFLYQSLKNTIFFVWQGRNMDIEQTWHLFENLGNNKQ